MPQRAGGLNTPRVVLLGWLHAERAIYPLSTLAQPEMGLMEDRVVSWKGGRWVSPAALADTAQKHVLLGIEEHCPVTAVSELAVLGGLPGS